MEATFLKRMFGVDGGWEYRNTKYVKGGVEIGLAARKEALRCGKCGSEEVARRGTRERRIRATPIGDRAVTLVVAVPRCQCRSCGEFFDSSPPLPPPGDPTAIALSDMLRDCAKS